MRRAVIQIGAIILFVLAWSPLLTGRAAAQTGAQYVLPGKPDGLGWYETDNFFFVYVNHEFDNATTTYLSDDTSGGGAQLTGARVSLLRFDKNWANPAGQNLITQVVDGGTTYILDASPGVAAYVDAANNLNTLVFNRFCSGSLALTGFVDDGGAAAPVWFAPEEVADGRGYAVFADGTALALTSLGRFAKEQVLAAAAYRAANSDTTVLIATEDSSDGELYLFVGQQTGADPNGFAAGQLYVLRLTDNLGNYIAREADMPAGQAVQGHWTAVAGSVNLDDAGELTAWVNASQRSTNFWRLEDIGEDPNNPGVFYFTTTGGGDGNPDGMLHRLTLADPPTGTAAVERLLSGSSSDSDPIGRRYDNVAVTGDGQVIVQEDGGGSEVLAYDIGLGGVTQLFDVNSNNWESSGVIENQPQAYLMSVQAHGGSVPFYGEAGALVLARPGGPAPLSSNYMHDLSGAYGLWDVLTVGTALPPIQPMPTALAGAAPAAPGGGPDGLVFAGAMVLALTFSLLWLALSRRRVA